MHDLHDLYIYSVLPIESLKFWGCDLYNGATYNPSRAVCRNFAKGRGGGGGGELGVL